MIPLKGKEGLPHVVGKDIQNVFQNLFKQRGKWRREVQKHVARYYTADAPRAGNSRKMVVCMADGRMHHGGLCDRLRGFVSVYSVCKAMGIDFRIYFRHPFRLEDYLLPNAVDWTVDDAEMCYNSRDAMPLFCGSNGTHVEQPFQRLWLRQNFAKDYRQVHVYTNAHIAAGKRFKPLFEELFKPSEALSRAVDGVLRETGGPFVAVTCRFQQLLGDFKEGDGQYEVLPPEERRRLMERCLQAIERIHGASGKQGGLPVLLTSDSVGFLDHATARLPYVHRVPGSLTHMDYESHSPAGAQLKSFADLLALGHAERVFLLKTGKMYNSGFPRIGALIGGKPFKLVRF